MPNWCSNTLHIACSGDPDDCKRLKKEIFETIRDPSDPESILDFEQIIPLSENTIPDYVWGTKWNARHVERSGDIIFFDTAWSPCFPVIRALAERFPEACFYYEYSEWLGAATWGKQAWEYGELSYSIDGTYEIIDEYYRTKETITHVNGQRIPEFKYRKEKGDNVD